MVKICSACNSTWAGGQFCEDCGAELHDPYGDAGKIPKGMWRYIRLQYGARRGMLVRVMAFLLAPVVFGLLAREAVISSSPLLGLLGAALAGVATWALVYWAAGKAVRIWVLRKGQLQKRKLARALLAQASLGGKRSST